MNRDKADKEHYVDNYWLPATNSVRDKYGRDKWANIEIANNIRDIQNNFVAKIEGLS
jgi:hypothetical protein